MKKAAAMKVDCPDGNIETALLIGLSDRETIENLASLIVTLNEFSRNAALTQVTAQE
jgi:hypothetical protein